MLVTLFLFCLLNGCSRREKACEREAAMLKVNYLYLYCLHAVFVQLFRCCFSASASASVSVSLSVSVSVSFPVVRFARLCDF